jgi:hypothetical protein
MQLNAENDKEVHGIIQLVSYVSFRFYKTKILLVFVLIQNLASHPAARTTAKDIEKQSSDRNV